MIEEERNLLGGITDNLNAMVINGDASRFPELVAEHHIPTIDYVITSPPYWNMLHQRGFETQQKRRRMKIWMWFTPKIPMTWETLMITRNFFIDW